MSYESTAKEVVETMFCRGCEIDCFDDDKCVWLTIKEAVEKQIQKKPIIDSCPMCGELVQFEICLGRTCDIETVNAKYCYNCGSKIDWRK